MRVAIVIDKDRLFIYRLLDAFKKMDWKADFFFSSSDFGSADISIYDAIIADISLKPIDGRQILRGIQNKTSAELFLIGTGQFTEIDINNDNIKGLLDKNNIEDIINKLKYVVVKKRIEDTLNNSSHKIQLSGNSLHNLIFKD